MLNVLNVDLALDCETELIAGGRLAPRLACISTCQGDLPKLHTPDDGIDVFERWVQTGSGWLIGHNIAFDLLCMVRHRPSIAPQIWTLYDQGRIWDTGIHERLYTLGMGWSAHPAIGKPIVTGGVSLAQLALALVGFDYGDQKSSQSAPRLHYGDLIGVPIENWPSSARDYALSDAEITYKVALYQFNRIHETSWAVSSKNENLELPSQTLQNQAAWALHHLSAWGLRSDKDRVEAWKHDLNTKLDQLRNTLTEQGLIKSDGRRDLKRIRALVQLAYGDQAPRTQKGQIQTSNEVLQDSGDLYLIKLAEYAEYDKLANTFGETLQRASDGVLSPRWNVLVRSGRTSCTKPNLQQLPRSGGVREAFKPREGYIFAGADYSTAELVALARVCEEWGIPSKMAEELRANRDLHLALAADMLGISYDEAMSRMNAQDEEIKTFRSLAKIPNFGLAGGLGAQGLQGFAKGYGKILSLDECRTLKRQWFAKWPEMEVYFYKIDQAVENGYIIQSKTRRRRGSIGYTDGANTMFQGLIADGAKNALYDVVRACWMEPSSPLYGCKPVLFIHDEIILEAPINRASAAADELARVMIDSMQPYLENLPIHAEPWISSRWSKSNRETRNDAGELIDCWNL